MKFDVIIGNPPYQLSTAGSVKSQATPIYNKFIEQAKKLNPHYLIMIVPSRWLNGGFGLDSFRDEMLSDNRLKILNDYLNSEECFPGVDLSGGVCYFLWDRDYYGECQVITHYTDGHIVNTKRPLLEKGADTFIRFGEAVSILKRIKSFNERPFEEMVSPRDPFGLNYYENGKEVMFKNYEREHTVNSIKIYYYGWQKDSNVFVNRKLITTNYEAVDKYKVLISKAYGERGEYPYLILGKPFIGEPETCCNMTYLLLGTFDKKEYAENEISYIKTKFFRFLVSLMKNTQNAYKKVYSFVPLQDFSEPWTDEKLYAKYGITEEEQQFIDSLIRPME